MSLTARFGAGPLYPTPFDTLLDTSWRGPIVGKWAHYFEAYERHFSRFRGTEVVVVEIGIKDGGSLALWRNYFGEKAFIIGADIFDGSVAIEGNAFFGRPDRIVIGDQGSDSFWKDVKLALPKGALDILIDDGSHRTEHMISSLENAIHLLRPGGVYVCANVEIEP